MQTLRTIAPYLQGHHAKLLQPLKAQVTDLRSVSAKEAGITIQVLSGYPDFEPIAVKLIPTLVKQLQSGNKLLAEVGHTSILGILTQIASQKV